MKKIIYLTFCILLLFTVSSQGAISIIYDIDIELTANAYGGMPGYGSESGNNYVTVSAFAEEGIPEEPWFVYWYIDSTFEAIELDDGGRLNWDVYSGGDGVGSGDSHATSDGTFTVGTDENNPLGTPLQIEITGGGFGHYDLFIEDNELIDLNEGVVLDVIAGYVYDISFSGAIFDQGNGSIDMIVVPEPATLMLLGLGGLLLRRKRRA